MGKIGFGFLTVLFSMSAMASEQYLCSAQAPQGQVQVVVQNDLSAGQHIYLRFYHIANNQYYVGTLNVTASEANTFVASGKLGAFEPNPSIDVAVNGTLDPNSNEVQTLQLYARSNGKIDRRLEQGFGNVLRCQKQ